MNRAVIILGLLIIVGYVSPDLSRAHSHVRALPEDGRQSHKSAEPSKFIGPVMKDTRGLKQTEQPSWDGWSLAHPDRYHFLGSDRHHSAAHRNSNAPDGVALMFSWPFASVPTFWSDPEGAPDEPILKQNRLR